MLRTTILFIFIFTAVIYSASSQSLQAYYSFDGCTLSEETGKYAPAIVRNNLTCDCGVGMASDAYYFNGTNDTMFLDNSIIDLFNNNNDFSIGFYFWLNPTVNSYTLMSIKEGCDRDSSFVVQYLPQSDELIVEFSRNIAEGVFFRTSLDENRCWQHVMLTKEGTTFALYLNGRFIQSREFLSQIDLGADYNFAVGYSDCVGITDQFFDGRIDEIQVYDYALKVEDISNILVYPDEILSQDTTIFQGDQFDVIAGASCAQLINWSPSTGVSNPFSATPTLSPDQTTLYEITFNHGNCIRVDSLLVSVLSQDAIDCQQLLLPKAFTPNNDNLNDFYGISNAFILESIDRFEIYNRWGMKVFEGANKSDSWDGTYKGEFQPPGTYIYKIEYQCQGSTYTKAGSFNILR